MYAVREGHIEVLQLLLDCKDNSEPEKLLTAHNKVSLWILYIQSCYPQDPECCFSIMFLVSSEGSKLSDGSSSTWPTGLPPANGSVHQREQCVYHCYQGTCTCTYCCTCIGRSIKKSHHNLSPCACILYTRDDLS